MGNCKVKDLFDVAYGNSLELVYLQKDPFGINFVSRTAKRNGVSERVHPIPWQPPFPAGLITVAVSGNVLETFLQSAPFYTGFHVMVLTPKTPMTDEMKLYYCQCLRANRYRYSYGRQANTTLSDLQIPSLEDVPDYVREFSLRQYRGGLAHEIELPETRESGRRQKGLVPLDELFQMVNGIPSGNVYRCPYPEGESWIPYLRPSYRQETSVDAYVSRQLIPREKIFPAGTLYVSTDGQGSHTFSYVSAFSFVPNSNVTVLLPKGEMSLAEKLYYAQCITGNRYKFSYGRKPKGYRLGMLLLPASVPEEIRDYDIPGLLERVAQETDTR